MIDQVEQLAANKDNVENVLNQLPVRAQEQRNILLDSVTRTNTSASGMQRLRTGIAFAAAIAVATALAGLLILMMGRR